jgi:hypothetical protein
MAGVREVALSVPLPTMRLRRRGRLLSDDVETVDNILLSWCDEDDEDEDYTEEEDFDEEFGGGEGCDDGATRMSL